MHNEFPQMVEIPGYKLEQELGSGGMATVYLAVQESVERMVALKVMSPILLADQTFSNRFIREAKIAANLYHPNIVSVYDVGLHKGQPYIAMEYLSGGDLGARCDGRPLEVRFAMRVAREIVTALSYAHGKGFVHRDVKPENILFREDDTAVLSDFGIARAVDSATQMTKTGAIIGTPQYMSPEQARGRELDGRSDFYGLGVVIFEMLTGKVPYQGTDSISVGIAHVTEPIPKLPPRLAFAQPLMDRFLSKQPEDRYQTGEDALKDLRELEARAITGENPQVQVETSVLRSSALHRATEPESGPDAPTPRETRTSGRSSRRVGVSATPRPDGKLRQEPTLGSLEDFASFDRTVGHARLEELKKKRAGPRSRLAGLLSVLLLVVIIGGAAAWWYRDEVAALVPNPEVSRLLDRAAAAIDYEHWYGDTLQYANRLYRRVLEIDPDNRRAAAGLELIAQHFADQAEQAYANGNSAQAGLLLQRAEELAPGLPRIDELRREFRALAMPATAEVGTTEPLPEPGGDGVDARLAKLLDEADRFVSEGALVRPPLDNALARYQAVLALAPEHPDAIEGIARLTSQLRGRTRAAISSGAFGAATDLIGDLSLIADPSEVAGLRSELQAARDRQQRTAEVEARRQAAVQQERQIEQHLVHAADLEAAGKRTGPAGDNALESYRSVLELDPGNARAHQGIDRIARRILMRAEVALEDDELDQAAELIADAAAVRSDLPGLERARDRLRLYRQQRTRPVLSQDARERLDRLVASAYQAMEAGDLMEPPGASAYDSLKAALSLDPDHPEVKAGLRELSTRLADMAGRALESGNLDAARGRLADATQTDPFNPALVPLTRKIGEALRDATRTAIEQSRWADARSLLEQASMLDPDHRELEQLQRELSVARDGG